MSFFSDLLRQAEALARWDKGKPRQANLRRAVSAAYYGLFHLLAEEASTRFSPTRPALLSSRISRTLNHGEMKEVCKSVGSHSSDARKTLSELHPGHFSPALLNVAATFLRLQEARYDADYDIEHELSRSTTLSLISAARRAVEDWHQVRTTDEATVFLAALLFARRWNR